MPKFIDRRVNIQRVDLEGDYHLVPTMPDDTKDHDDTVDCWCCPRLLFSCAISQQRKWMHFRYHAPGVPCES